MARIPITTTAPRNGWSSWTNLVVQVGVPATIALFLVWIGAQFLPDLMRKTELIHQDVLRNTVLLQEHRRMEEEQMHLLRWICAGVQKDRAAATNCFAIGLKGEP